MPRTQKNLIIGGSFALTTRVTAAFFPLRERGEPKQLNAHNRSGDIGETTIADFEKQTGIKVQYDNHTGNFDTPVDRLALIFDPTIAAGNIQECRGAFRSGNV